MVPRKFNIVDFGEFDLAGQYGEVLPGIYDKIVDAHWNCVYIMCFGLKFGGFDIVPQYMVPEMFSDHIMLNGIISIDQNDVITVPSIEPPAPQPVIIPGTFEENGTFIPPSGVTGYAPVTVNVSEAPTDPVIGVFENGGVNPQGASSAASYAAIKSGLDSNRIRTVGMVNLVVGLTYEVTINAGYKVAIYCFKPDGGYIAEPDYAGFWNDTFQFDADNPYISVMIRKENDSNITPSEVVNSGIAIHAIVE